MRIFSSKLTIKTLILFSTLFIFSCKSLYNKDYPKPELVDTKLNRSTKKLHKKLFYLTKKGFAIGQQDATSYGVDWKHDGSGINERSDMKDLTNKLPAVFGFDIGHIELGEPKNLDSVNFDLMRSLIIDAHKKGGIITISWHVNNPSNGSSSWDTTPVVKDIVSKGKLKSKYDLWIKRVANFLKTLKYRGKEIPVIFRPFHEMNGHWFWWGDPNSTAEDYKQLWVETIELLRDEHKLHNLLYTYSPNLLHDNDDYLKFYPGDAYVDILGVDIYDFNDSENYRKSLFNDISLVGQIAKSKNKLYALTETGLDKIGSENWFTEVLYPNLENTGISWVLFWRNARKSHHYIPYKGHKNANDFIKFANYPKTLFLKDIKEL